MAVDVMITLEEAAERLKVGIEEVHWLVEVGVLNPVDDGGRLLLSLAEVPLSRHPRASLKTELARQIDALARVMARGNGPISATGLIREVRDEAEEEAWPRH